MSQFECPVVRAMTYAGVPMVPELYRGPFSAAAVNEHTNGKTTLGGAHIREGVVVKATAGERHPLLGRKIAKSISEAYLLRKGEVSELQ